MYWKCAWSICVILNVVQDTASRGYALKCPEASQRSMRARLVCGKEVWYHCLYDENEMRYVETCEIAKELTTGRKAVYSGNIDARVCSSRRYMPFIYISNMSADCLYQRSYCNEEGQIQLHERSSAEDTACLCDFTKGYAFVTQPKAVCYCVPSEEDCSCYKKSCQDNSYMLSPDYRCVPRTSSISGVRCQVSLSKIPEDLADVAMGVFDTESLNRNCTDNRQLGILVAAILFVVCLIVTFTVLVIICDIGDIEVDIFRINCTSAVKVLYLDGEKLQMGFENQPRILDVCFMNLDSKLFLLYIDADNDTIVRRAVDDCEKYDQANFQKPNRLTKVDNTRVAIIHKKNYDIDIFDVEDMTTEQSYVGTKKDFKVKGKQYFIEGLVALSPNTIILSNKERLLKATLNEGKVTIADYADSIKTKFDTARRLTCTTVLPNDAKIIFIADENDKTITCIRESGHFICQLDSHNRGLQNVRSIAATEEYVIAATSAGVSVYTHDSQGFVNKEYSMLIEYNVHVDHTRGLCIETIGNRMFLALACVIKRKDVIAVFSFETSDLKKLRK